MKHKEYSEVCKIGEEVWICDYRYKDIDNQPIRHIKPRKVVVVSNEELPKNKRVYYSNFHFRPVNDKGKVLTQIIAPYDNTGYRAFTGVSLNIFYTEEECKQHYLSQCIENLNMFEQAKINKIEYYNKMIDAIDKEIFENSTVNTYEIWAEGYAATGDYSPAHYFGSSEGVNFKHACDRFARDNENFKKYYSPERMTHWGCKLFDNHADAAVRFG